MKDKYTFVIVFRSMLVRMRDIPDKNFWRKSKNIFFIPIYIQQDATLHSLFYLETALHVSDGTTTHHQESKQLSTASGICQHRYCYLPRSWESWNWFEAHSDQFHLFHDSGR